MTQVLKPFLLPLLLGAAVAVSAEDSVEPVELWNGFTTASTKDDIKAFKATQPKRRVEFIPGCSAEMAHRHVKGQLVSILFLGQDRDADCFARLKLRLEQERGEPEIGSTTFGSVIGLPGGAVMDTTSPGTVLIWREGEKKTKLVKSPGNGYNLIYTVRPDKFIH